MHVDVHTYNTKMNETEKTTPKDFLNQNVVNNSEGSQTDAEHLFCKAPHTICSGKETCKDQHLRTQQPIENCREMIETDRKMPIKRLLNEELLNKYVSENSEVLESDGKELFCRICKKNISFDTKHLVYRHLKSKKHTKILTNKYIEVQKDGLMIHESLNKYVAENTEAFKTDGESLWCKLCKKSVPFDKKSSVDRHLKSQKHLYYYAQKSEKTPLNTVHKHLSEAKKTDYIWQKNEDFCRTCMQQFSTAKQQEKQSITEIPAGYQNNITIMEILEIIQPQIKVEIKENLPTLMCSDCIEKLMASYEFIEMYQNVDKKLRKMLDDLDMDKCHNDSVEPPDLLEEIEVPDNFGADKYEIEIEQITIDEVGKQEIESDNEWPEYKDELKHDSPDELENNETVYSNPYSDASDDDWMPKNCHNTSLKSHNSDDATRKVFKGFFQPEKNDDGSLTCQLCKSVLDGVLSWRDHIRQNHFEEKPRRAYNRRTNKPMEKEPQKVRRKIEPNEEGLFKCEYCDKAYPRYIFYRRHLRVHTQEPHLCIECGKSFSLLSSYTSHMLRHKGEKNFKCPHCPKSFVCSSGLYNHAITHTNNKPYVCDICGSAFHMAYQLKKHNRIHTGVKKYQCEYCDMRFITGEKQRRHMRTHTGEKPYRCKYCERAFAQSNDCVKHLRQHLGDNVYQCDLCPLRFPLLRELRVHFASHKDDDDETRARNLQGRKEAEKNLQIKLGSKETT